MSGGPPLPSRRKLPLRLLALVLVAAAALALFAIRRARVAGPGGARTAVAGASAGVVAAPDPLPAAAAHSAAPGAAAAPGDPAAAPAAPASAGDRARLADGLVVWESNRTGSWRLWSSRLDGSELKQISPEDGRQHCCPHISPDGKLVAYLNLPRDIESYTRQPEEAELRLIGSDGKGERVAAPRAQTYGRGNRAAIWHAARKLQFIDGQGRSVLLDVESGATEVLAQASGDRRGWLINAARTHATTGFPTFSVYEPAQRAVAERSVFGGCEPYFSHDGRWGVWVAGAGGPIYRLDLATRSVGRMLEKNDPRLGVQGYLYFPMPARSGDLMVFAASAGEHDHNRGNYEVFVVEIDPRSFELLDKPLRHTDHPASDRYPDVWVAPLPLGRHFGEAPLTVNLEAGPGEWRWSFGDGAPEDGGPRARHHFAQPGSYAVTATRGGRRLDGRVVVRPAAPPQPLGVVVRGGREVRVEFDEPIDAGAARARLGSGGAVTGLAATADGRGLTVRLAADLRGRDTLRLEGVRDRAERPNALPPTELELREPVWPSSREGLIFLWERAGEPNLVPDARLGAERAFALTARGVGRYDHDKAMRLDGGSFTAGAEAAPHIVAAAERANEVSLEATITPDDADPAAPESTAIVTLMGERRMPNLLLGQRGDRLFVELRTLPKPNPPVELGRIAADQPSHVVVGYTAGSLVGYLNGEKVLETDALQGGLRQWKPGPIVFGDVPAGGRAWSGTLEGIALYDRLLPADETRENQRLYAAQLAGRPAVPRLRLAGRLVAKSHIPTLDEIAPYREALTVYEYEVERVLEGEYPHPRVRVAHWAILDGEERPAARAQNGMERRLLLEPFASNPQLESVVVADDLPKGSLPLFYDLRP